MHRSRRRREPSPPADPVNRRRRGGCLRLSSSAATGGLVTVLVVLASFSVTAAVTTAWASADVQKSAVVWAWSQEAVRSLRMQEEIVDRLAVEPDAELRAHYDRTSATTRKAIASMGSVEAGDPVGEWLRLHARYEYAVGMLLASSAGSRGIAEEYEDVYVDPHYDALRGRIEAVAELHWAQAGESLESMREVQRLLLLTTPVVFGVGLGLIG